MPQFRRKINSETKSPIFPLKLPFNLRNLREITSKYLWPAYSNLNGGYVALISIVMVVLISFLLPLTQKYNANELKTIKKVVYKMTDEVKQAEVACMEAANEICTLKCSVQDDGTETVNQSMSRDISMCSCALRTVLSEPSHNGRNIGHLRREFFLQRNPSHKEFTIMSYLYTNSFEDKNNWTRY